MAVRVLVYSDKNITSGANLARIVGLRPSEFRVINSSDPNAYGIYRREDYYQVYPDINGTSYKEIRAELEAIRAAGWPHPSEWRKKRGSGIV